MKIKFQIELTEKELAAAILPSGGKIVGIEVESTPTRQRRTVSQKKDIASPNTKSKTPTRKK